ncbi:fungal-specific transcription factor domain-containing protein [Stachybotrys elegans]|uniref:Fungal-specific transcription factor domain-containing protein n=1 Tax=Stachybotrys elegans TaxID=80388 RepID=A0A8K0WUG2_9HYPO|nr:fungal-specific transcription factor domain-containing protein [Stachybotrys elegans]
MNPSAQGLNYGRKYRSKKQRPCDLCRSRKIQCKLQGTGGHVACELCARLDRQCTFVTVPLRRKHRLPPVTVDTGADTGAENPPRIEPTDAPVVSPRDEILMGVDVDTFWQGATEALNPQAASHLPHMSWSPFHFDTGAQLSTTQDHVAVPSAGPSQGSVAHSSRSSQDSGESPGSSRAAVFDSTHAHRNASQALGVDWRSEFSIDRRNGCSSVVVGFSSEFDPYFMRHYAYNAQDVYPMFRLHVRKMLEDRRMRRTPASADASPPLQSESFPLHFLLVDENVWKDEETAAERVYASGGSESKDLELLNQLVPLTHGARLVHLYTQFVHPSYPVLSNSQLSDLLNSDMDGGVTVGLRSAVYALAAPFTFWDDELSVSKGYRQVPADDLWAIAERSYHRASNSSHLSLMQLCLLILQKPPQSFVAAEPPRFWALSCAAVAIAETLGLNLDPAGWRLPRKEIMLRRRLWWITYTVHTWLALVSGQPSHIQDSNWDVSSLVADDFETDHNNPFTQESVARQVPLCIAQCQLAVIAADILKDFYTLKANRETLDLSGLLSRAQPLRTRIEAWRQTLPLLSKPVSELSAMEFEQGAALRLSHLTLEILIFRALLRPLLSHTVSLSEGAREPISTIFENCYTCAKVATEIVSSLRAKHFARFWLHYTRYQLCYVSTFILLSFSQSTTREMAARYRDLLTSWRDTLRIQAQAWPLARLAAMRLDAIFWKGLLSVVEGSGSDSPAVLLLQE